MKNLALILSLANASLVWVAATSGHIWLVAVMASLGWIANAFAVSDSS